MQPGQAEDTPQTGPPDLRVSEGDGRDPASAPGVALDAAEPSLPPLGDGRYPDSLPGEATQPPDPPPPSDGR